MGTFLVAFQTVLPLFLLIFTGIIFSRIKKSGLQNWVEILNKYALWIGFPALVIYSLMQLKPEGNSFSGFILLNSAFILGSMLLVFPVSRIFRFSAGMKRSLFLILPFGNVSYLGIPILLNAYGVNILPYAAIISAVYVFWLLTLAIFLIELYGHEKTEPKKLMLSLAENPLLLSVFIGLAIVLFKIPVPAFLGKTIQLFAESVTAVVLFSLGIFLGMQQTGKLRDWLEVAMWCLITMILLPFLFYHVVKFTGVEVSNLKAIIIDAAMPLGVTPYVLAVQYKLKTTLIARIIVFGTLLSMVVIPLWMVMLK
jgi:predicted permease